MKTSPILLTVFIVVLLSVALALANPTMLPKPPGYPMGKAVDPVSGQALANDQNDHRLLEKPGAGLLPKVQGPNIKIEPPVKEGTKVSASPQ